MEEEITPAAATNGMTGGNSEEGAVTSTVSTVAVTAEVDAAWEANNAAERANEEEEAAVAAAVTGDTVVYMNEVRSKGVLNNSHK